MITLRPAASRGHTKIFWLDSWHTFSFGDYYDEKNTQFSCLRVINDDRVAPGQGFDTHGHRDMEIVTYVLEGALQHKDSLGTGSIIKPGDVQRMSAGTGILHSEYNPSQAQEVHLLQIWILPEKKGTPPSYEQKNFSDSAREGKFLLVGSRDGRQGSVTIHQDIDMYVANLTAGKKLEFALKAGRKAWLHVAKGNLMLNGKEFSAGDSAGISDEAKLALVASADAEALLWDLP